MGGSNSGGWAASSSSMGGCETLTFDAQLNSPQPTTISSLSVGERLSVALSPPPGQVVRIEKNGLLAGVVTGSNTGRLVGCLQEGFVFEAEVLAVAGGMCTVRILPA